MWSTLWSLIDMYKEDFLLRRYIWHFVHFCMRENKGQIGGLGKKLEIETLQNLQIVHPQCAPTNLGTHTLYKARQLTIVQPYPHHQSGKLLSTVVLTTLLCRHLRDQSNWVHCHIMRDLIATSISHTLTMSLCRSTCLKMPTHSCNVWQFQAWVEASLNQLVPPKKRSGLLTFSS